MIATIASEWIKLRTVRVHTVLVLIAVAFPLVITTLASILVSDLVDLDGRGLAELVTGSSVVSVMLFGTVSAISLTGDFGHGTIRPTFAATPDHRRVYGAKLVVNTVASGLAAVALIAVCWAVGAIVVSQRGGSVGISAADGSLGSLLALVVLAMTVAWLAFGLGLVLRSSPATISVLLLWPLIAEGLVAGVLFLAGADGAVRWLPFNSVLSAIPATPGDDTLGRPWAFVWFGSVAAFVVGVGLLLDRRRDS